MVRYPSEQSSTLKSVTYDCLNVRSLFQENKFLVDGKRINSKLLFLFYGQHVSFLNSSGLMDKDRLEDRITNSTLKNIEQKPDL